ncbi:uncharacterized protein UDID_05773 [Ustilago sp. UG-2017a]|nr:uncharacterized protein UDID_05773 [Ustilago sp. UG-2017a]
MPSAVAAAMPQQAPKTKKPVLTIDATNLSKPTTPNFNIPKIVITPPDEPARYSSPLPEQRFEKAVLFVPVKTEELGWEEHGLYWNGTYAYPVHQIYDREGQPIGRRRKGPQGYRFEEYYENKKPRRSSSSQQASASDEMEVEEAVVRLDEPAPAPARIEERNDKVNRSIEEERNLEEEKLAELQVEDDEDEDMPSPSSPTLSVTETEDSASFCDDSSSLWSRNEAESDDEESVCTSPGIMSPPMGVDEDFQPETLSKKLSDLPAPSSGSEATKTSWISLGTLPSSSAPSSSPSQSLPTARVKSKKSLEFSKNNRATSTLIPDSHRDSRRQSTPSAYTSIIQDLTTSSFASSSASTPFRSATLPRSSSRSGYNQSKVGGSIFHPPPPHVASPFAENTGSLGRPSASPLFRRGGDVDFSAGWNFENHTAKMSNWAIVFPITTESRLSG